MTIHEEFVCKLENMASGHNDESVTDEMIDLIYYHIDSLLLKGDFYATNWILYTIDQEVLPTVLHLSFLTVTLAAKNRLFARDSFYHNAYHRVRAKEGVGKADRIFQGLE